MIRLSSLLLATMLAVTPTMDVVCRAVCTPDTTAADASSCHEVASPTSDGVLLPAVACQPDVVAAVAPAAGARNLGTSAPRVTAPVKVLAHAPASTSADLRRQAIPPLPLHGYPSTIVLRI